MDSAATAELTIRMLLGLAVIVGMLALGTRMVRRRVGGAAAVAIDVRGRQVLSKAASVAVVQVGSRNLLLGVSEHGVSLLAEGDDLVDDPTAGTDSGDSSAIDLTDAIDATEGAATTDETGGTDARRPRIASTALDHATVIDALRQRTVRKS